jgi:predicted phage terminase large subunit-like protein
VVAENDFPLIHQFRDRREFPDLLRTVKHLADQFSPDLVLIEYQASGRSLVQDLYNNTRLPIKAVKITRESKQLRAELVTPLVESGRVFLPQRANWISDFLYEVTVFPAGNHSDQVDALSQALLSLKGRFDRNRRPRRERLAACLGTPTDPEKPLSARQRLRLYGGPRINLTCRWIERN